jgi:hypothetical protein
MPGDVLRLRDAYEIALSQADAQGCTECVFCTRITRRRPEGPEHTHTCPLCFFSLHHSCAQESLESLAAADSANVHAFVSACWSFPASSSGVEWAQHRVECAYGRHPLPVEMSCLCYWCRVLVQGEVLPP